MKKQPLKFRMNTIGGAVLIFLIVRTYIPPVMLKLGLNKNINIWLFLYIWCEIMACILPITFMEYMCDFHPYLFGKKTNMKRAVPIVFSSMFIFLMAAVVNRIVIVQPLTKLGVPLLQNKLPNIKSPLTFVLCLVFYTVTPAIFEELFMRGLALNMLKEYGQKFAIVATAFTFTIMHTQLQNFIPIFVAGLTLGCVYVYTDNIYISMLLHFVNNLYSFLIMYTSQSINGISAVSFSIYIIAFIIAMGIYSLTYLKKNGVSVYSALKTGEKLGIMRMFNSPIFIISTVCCLVSVFERLYQSMAL